jgi:hypothetical protein
MFSQLNAFSNHQRNCMKSKKRLSGALEKAKELWSARKRARLATSSGACLPMAQDVQIAHASASSSGLTTVTDTVCLIHKAVPFDKH